ncbi:hypothetical protein NPIL_193381 [Nephila pilipes]|uniref:Uncharacterized protein n=1 Tax=Nephila pilipes TaxID=299642 RepID=A0A8X6NG51_NEPPI|nr:hypothetical protein NPIL_193381 [Nephila pilipes]
MKLTLQTLKENNEKFKWRVEKVKQMVRSPGDNTAEGNEKRTINLPTRDDSQMYIMKQKEEKKFLLLLQLFVRQNELTTITIPGKVSLQQPKITKENDVPTQIPFSHNLDFSTAKRRYFLFPDKNKRREAQGKLFTLVVLFSIAETDFQEEGKTSHFWRSDYHRMGGEDSAECPLVGEDERGHPVCPQSDRLLGCLRHRAL